MIPGMYMRSIGGRDGLVTVPGLGAVAAEIGSWKLERREEIGTDGPYWTLHASFRFQTDLLLKNDALKKHIVLKLRDHQQIELCEWGKVILQDRQAIFEGVKQCQT